MNLIDFRFSEYRQLLDAALGAGWNFRTVDEYLDPESPPNYCIILRHDVDRRPANALALARTESARDIKATYYFRTKTFDEEVVQEIDALGHEIGYHYEDLSETRGDLFEAQRRFRENIEAFRNLVDIRTVCGHGRSLSPYTDGNLLSGRLDEFEDLGIVGEANQSIETYPDSNTYYLSDTGRTWRAELPTVGTVRTTADLMEAIERRVCRQLYVNAHPDRWTRNPAEFTHQLAWDLGAECAKTIASSVHKLLPDQQVEVSDEAGRSIPRKDN